MSWFFSIFLGVVAVCTGLYIIRQCINLFSPSKTCDAVVEKRFTEEFPLTIGICKRNRKDRYLQFRTDTGETMTLSVLEDIYNLFPTGTEGHLCYRGSVLVGFVPLADEKRET